MGDPYTCKFCQHKGKKCKPTKSGCCKDYIINEKYYNVEKALKDNGH